MLVTSLSPVSIQFWQVEQARGLSMVYNVQYLRFFAAAAVTLFHALGKAGGEIQFPLGQAGVDVFFVISGFIMVLITELRERSPMEFFQHRLARVAPPYWFVTLALATGLLLFPSAFSFSSFSFPVVVTSLLFWPYPHYPVSTDAAPLYGPGWTLNFEFFFYSLFAVALAVNVSLRAWLVSAALIGAALVGRIWPNDGVAYSFYTDPLPLEFIYGMIIASLVMRGVKVGAMASLAMILLGVASLYIGSFYFSIIRLSPERFLVWGAPAALIVAGSVFLELRTKPVAIKLLEILGNASYAIYITHFAVFGPVVKIGQALGFRLGWFLTLVAFIAAILIGVAFHFFIENPLVRFFRKS